MPAAANADIADTTTMPDVTEEEPEIAELPDEEVPLAVVEDEEDTELVEAEDEEVPLANMEQTQEASKNGLWWSIIPILGAAATGKTAYDKKNKKGIFAEKETVKNSDNRNK